MQAKSILLADDDAEDIELLEEVITALEPTTTVHAVLNGKQALEYLSELEDKDLPHLILLDYNMPVMNGAEVLKLLCTEERYQGIPKIIWSTSNTQYHIKECKENGALDYLVKPGNMSELTALAKQLLAICEGAAS